MNREILRGMPAFLAEKMGEFCCINEINCHLLQKRNRYPPECGMENMMFMKNGISIAVEMPEIKEIWIWDRPGQEKTG